MKTKQLVLNYQTFGSYAVVECNKLEKFLRQLKKFDLEVVITKKPKKQ